MEFCQSEKVVTLVLPLSLNPTEKCIDPKRVVRIRPNLSSNVWFVP